MKKIINILLLFVLSFQLYSQPFYQRIEEAYKKNAVYDYNTLFKTIPMSDEWHSNVRVEAIVESADGFIWFGTHEGVGRYNGFYTQNIAFKNVPDNVPNKVLCMEVDKYNNIWAGSVNGLFLYNRQKNIFEPFLNNNLNNKQIRAMCMKGDTLALLTFTMTEMRIVLLNPKNKTVFLEYKLSQEEIYDDQIYFHDYLIFDTQNRLWFGGRILNTGYFENNEDVFLKYDNNEFLTFGFIELPNNEIWMVGDKLYIYRNGIINTSDKIIHRYAFLNTSSGLFWGGYGQNLTHLTPNNQIFNYQQKHLIETSFIGGYINTIFEDRNKNIWIGTSKGVSILPYQSNILKVIGIELLTETSSFRSIAPYGNMLQSSDNTVWSGSESDGLIKMNPTTYQVTSFRYNMLSDNALASYSNNVTGVTFDNEQNIWLSLWNADRRNNKIGVQKFNPYSNEFTTFFKKENWIEDFWISGIVFDFQNRLRLGSWGFGYGVIDFDITKGQIGTDNFSSFFFAAPPNTKLFTFGNHICYYYDIAMLINNGNNNSTLLVTTKTIDWYMEHYINNNVLKILQPDAFYKWWFNFQDSFIAIAENGMAFFYPSLQHLKLANLPIDVKLNSDSSVLWISEKEQIIEFQLNTQKVIYHQLQTHTEVKGIEVLPDNNLLTIFGDSVFIYQPATKEYVFQKKLFDNSKIQLLQKTSDNRIWLITDSSFYCYRNGNWFSTKNTSIVYDVQYDKYRNTTWFAHANGLFCLEKMKNYKPNFGEYATGIENITQIIVTDSILFLNSKYNLLYFNPEKEFFIEKEFSKYHLYQNLINWIKKEETARKIWINGNDLFLSCMLPTNPPTFQHYIRNRDFPNVEFFDIATNEQNKTWLATSTGLLQLDTVTQKFEKDTFWNLPQNMEINALLFHQKGLWCCGGNQLYFSDSTQKVFVFNDILNKTTDEFEPRSFLELNDGRICVGSQSGFVLFHPDSLLKMQQIQSNYLFNELKTNDSSYQITSDTIELNYTSRWAKFTVGYFGFNKNEPHNLQLICEGKTLKKEISNHGIEFTFDLEAGKKYILQLKEGNRIIKKLVVEVESIPLYLKTIFWIVIFVAISIIIVLLILRNISIKTKKEKAEKDKAIAEQNRELAEKSKTIAEQEAKQKEAENQLTQSRVALLQSYMYPHFVANALENARALLNTDKENAEIILTRLSFIMKKLSIKHSKPTWTLAEEFEIIERYLEIQKIRFSDRYESIEILDSSGFRDNMPIMRTLVFSHVENAFRHGLEAVRSRKWIFSIEYETNEEFFIIRVIDNGKGFEVKDMRKEGALSKIQELLNLQNQRNQNHISYTFDSAPDKGTTVTICLPLQYVYKEQFTN